jgi:hypothetical protein
VIAARRGPRSRRLTALFAVVSFSAASLFAWGLAASQPAAAAGSGTGFAKTETITRTHLVNGANVQVDERKFSVSLDNTRNLRDRQGIAITWSGAHPTGGVVFDVNSPHAAEQEYPVAILQCRGVDSKSVPAKQQLSPETCFTQTPDTRYQGPYRGKFPSYRVDRYAPPAERRMTVGAPTPIPAKCIDGDGAQRWVPFIAADGTTYPGGFRGCGGLAPEQSNLASNLNPSNETFGTTDQDGNGTARFIVQDGEDNASLGCSATVVCSLVVVPIMGISCDASAAGLPVADRPAADDLAGVQKDCQKTGFYQPGQPSGSQSIGDPNAQVPVTGLLWWSASNWRNRISVPLTFAETAASCDVVGGGAPTNIFGSEYMLQATQQWAPTFCQDKNLFRLQHTQTSEVQAKNLLATGVTNGTYQGVKAAFEGGPPPTKFANPIVQAPTALTGFAIGFVMDDGKHHQYTQLKLNARLLAKLMTMSYPALPAVKYAWGNDKTYSQYLPSADNPLDLSVDPEFLALNPGMKSQFINQLEASSTLFTMSSDSDVMTALTSYINADPEARAWLDGAPDPWGMVVNPNYKKIALPTASWPLLDTYYSPLNECIEDSHSPILPLIAGPVSDPAQVTFNLQYGIGNSQVNCVITGETDSPGNRRLAGLGAQQPGIRFLLGLVSLADAQRYGILTAALQSQKSASAPEKFTDATGRTFVAPTNAALLAAAKMLEPDDALGTWPVPYDALRTDPDGKNAYPGTMLMSTDVPTAGLLAADAERYSKFLTYVAGPGQIAGTGNGQLAAGYVPITAADGLGGLHDYTVAAANAVRQQRGFLPKPSRPTIQAVPSGSATPSPTHTRHSPAPPHHTTAPAGSSDGAPPPPGNPTVATTSAKPSPSSSASPSARPSPVASSPALQPVSARTANTRPGWSALALPALAVIALASGLLATWMSGIGRR